MDSFLKLLSVVLGLEELINSLEPNKTNFKTIDDVLKVDDNAVTRQRCKKND
ncbi:protein of unknown function [Chryseobacterium sp. JV274]|nr:protein of unknown function [Chryseobacterium sp. JV274]